MKIPIADDAINVGKHKFLMTEAERAISGFHYWVLTALNDQLQATLFIVMLATYNTSFFHNCISITSISNSWCYISMAVVILICPF